MSITPTITWSNPANITYGTPLSSTQLDATASVPGTFVYTPPLGTVLNVGLNQLLNITFTPNDAANYTTTSATTSINLIGVPDAHFRINQTQGTVPPDVQFKDKTTGSPTEWYWVFGDGTTSNLQNPKYTYTTLENY